MEQSQRAVVAIRPKAADGGRVQSLRRHHHTQRHLDEILIAVDYSQGAAHIVSDIAGSRCSSQFVSSIIAASRESWFSLSLKSSEGSRSEFGIAIPPWSTDVMSSLED